MTPLFSRYLRNSSFLESGVWPRQLPSATDPRPRDRRAGGPGRMRAHWTGNGGTTTRHSRLRRAGARAARRERSRGPRLVGLRRPLPPGRHPPPRGRNNPRPPPLTRPRPRRPHLVLRAHRSGVGSKVERGRPGPRPAARPARDPALPPHPAAGTRRAAAAHGGADGSHGPLGGDTPSSASRPPRAPALPARQHADRSVGGAGPRGGGKGVRVRPLSAALPWAKRGRTPAARCPSSRAHWYAAIAPAGTGPGRRTAA